MTAPFCPSYVSGDPRALAFLAPWFRDPEARMEHARAASTRGFAHPELVAIIAAQNGVFPSSEARARNLAALAEPGTVVAVTGQQMGLFVGPLFTLYKTASTIAVARAIERESGVRCVPLFWMQTEDHDFEEINHCHIHVPGAPPLRVAVRDAAADALGEIGARISVSHRRLGADVLGALDAVDEALGPLPHAAEFLPLLRQHYQPGQTLGAAFAGVMATLFADEGLVLFDARTPEVGRITAGLFETAFARTGALAGALVERGRALEAAGFAEQVHVRADSPLAFFHEPTSEGPRYRLQKRGERFALIGCDRSVDAAERALASRQDPLRCSSSALLRPLVQDALLPTAAYVGGAAEVSYFAQIAPLYPLVGLPPPLVVPRARFRILDDNTRSLLAKLGLEPGDVEQPREALLAKLAAASPSAFPSAEEVAAALTGDFHARLEALAAQLPAIDANLVEPARRTRQSVDVAVGRFIDRYRRALGESDSVRLDRVERLTRMLHPDGIPQERFHSLPYFACRFGLPALKRALFAALDPWDPTLRDLVP